jgi:hypothetical protein
MKNVNNPQGDEIARQASVSGQASLDAMASSNTPAYFPILFPYLLDPDGAIRERAAGILISVFRGLRSKGALLRALRPVHITVEHMEAWQHLFEGDSYCYLLAMASFSGNGYARERAVVLLAGIGQPMAIRYLLLRAGDCVKEVRDAAYEAIHAYMKPEWRGAFIKELMQVRNLLAERRVRLLKLYCEIRVFITEERLTLAMLRLSADGRVRRLLVEDGLGQEGSTPRMLELIMNDRCYQVRMELVDYVLVWPAEIRITLYRRLLKDKCARVRRAVLADCDDCCDQLQKEIDDLLNDPSPSVRRLAMKYVRRQHEGGLRTFFPPLDQKLPWESTQAAFVAYVMSNALPGFFRKGNRPLSLDELGELFLKVYDVDIWPYPDFHSLRVAVPPSIEPEELAACMLGLLEGEQAILEATEGTGILPSKEGQIKRMACELIAKDLLERLSRHIYVHRDEQGNII